MEFLAKPLTRWVCSATLISNNLSSNFELHLVCMIMDFIMDSYSALCFIKIPMCVQLGTMPMTVNPLTHKATLLESLGIKYKTKRITFDPKAVSNMSLPFPDQSDRIKVIRKAGSKSWIRNGIKYFCQMIMKWIKIMFLNWINL